MQLFAGTSGFSYPEWKGPFDPAELADAGLLAYDAARLPAVETNDTFCRMPPAPMPGRWAGRVPEGFRSALESGPTLPRPPTEATPRWP
jgi:uncharacterized protein YecE (DUF72 family)